MKKLLWLVVVLTVSLACRTISSQVAVPTPIAQPTAAASGTIAQPTATTVEATQTVLSENTPQVAAVVEAAPAGLIAREHLVALSAEIGPRVAGTAGERAAQDYIFTAFESIGYSPEVQEFSVVEDAEGETIAIRSANVIAVKSGKSSQEIIVGAHYDSTGDAGRGADDNASAVAVMLEVAENIVGLETPYTIRFIAFGSEEINLNGSYAYAGQMSREEIDNTIAMINLDSLAAGDNTYLYSDEGRKAELRDWALAWADEHGFELQTIANVDLTDDGYGISDHFPFQEIGIPYAYFEATNWALGDQDGYTQVDSQYGENGYIWHTQYDNIDYLDQTFPGRVDEHLNLFVSVLQAVLTEYIR
ncbi:MAG: Zn-dependent exopeptidase M28 [Chloroflexi bacterium HGW-Chloroflexi-6]|nr:MAG: Zn-dependent exopeptidase M28 [Chloroflexi bacterium HGW-Chloroflexi-6]